MITIENQSHLVVKNLLVRGGQNGVLISGDAASHNVIENCRLVGGEKRVFITDGASYNHVRHNEITAAFYGDRYRPGAWGGPRGDAAPYENRVKEHFYNEYKWFFGPNATSDYGVRVFDAGPHNEIYGNHVSEGGQGIQVTRCSDARVYKNTVHNFSSIGLICTLDRVKNVQFYDNLVYDCNINLRIHHVNQPGQTADRTFYVYRNRFYQNPGVGSHIFMHYFEENDTEDYNHANVFIYHNSFSGGQNGISMSGYADDCGGLPNGIIVNNILSSRFSLSASRDFIGRSGMFGLFDFNWIGGEFKSTDPGHDYTHASWYGRHNIFEAGAMIWDHAEMPDFILPEQSMARDGGLDLSELFSVNGKQYGSLPGMSSGYFSDTEPDMGAVQYVK